MLHSSHKGVRWCKALLVLRKVPAVRCLCKRNSIDTEPFSTSEHVEQMIHNSSAPTLSTDGRKSDDGGRHYYKGGGVGERGPRGAPLKVQGSPSRSKTQMSELLGRMEGNSVSLTRGH